MWTILEYKPLCEDKAASARHLRLGKAMFHISYSLNLISFLLLKNENSGCFIHEMLSIDFWTNFEYRSLCDNKAASARHLRLGKESIQIRFFFEVQYIFAPDNWKSGMLSSRNAIYRFLDKLWIQTIVQRQGGNSETSETWHNNISNQIFLWCTIHFCFQ